MERSRLAHGPRVLSLAQSSHLKSEQSAGWIGVSRLAEDRRKDTAVLACDVGGTRLRVARVYPDGSVCGKQAISTPQGRPHCTSASARRGHRRPWWATRGGSRWHPGTGRLLDRGSLETAEPAGLGRAHPLDMPFRKVFQGLHIVCFGHILQG